MNWLVELVDGTTVYHEGGLYVPANGMVTLTRPVWIGGNIHVLYERISPEDVVGITSTLLTRGELEGINLREKDV